MQYKVGDLVTVRMFLDFGGTPFSYNFKLSEKDSNVITGPAEIIAVDSSDGVTPYMIHCPWAESKSTNNHGAATSGTTKYYDVDPKWHGKIYWWASPFAIDGLAAVAASVKIQNDGCSCLHCEEWYDMAVANTTDGRLLCYSCRATEIWRYPGLMK